MRKNEHHIANSIIGILTAPLWFPMLVLGYLIGACIVRPFIYGWNIDNWF